MTFHSGAMGTVEIEQRLRRLERMAKADIGTVTITVEVSFPLTMWEALKWRVAGREIREVIADTIRERMKETLDGHAMLAETDSDVGGVHGEDHGSRGTELSAL